MTRGLCYKCIIHGHMSVKCSFLCYKPQIYGQMFVLTVKCQWRYIIKFIFSHTLLTFFTAKMVTWKKYWHLTVNMFIIQATECCKLLEVLQCISENCLQWHSLNNVQFLNVLINIRHGKSMHERLLNRSEASLLVSNTLQSKFCKKGKF